MPNFNPEQQKPASRSRNRRLGKGFGKPPSTNLSRSEIESAKRAAFDAGRKAWLDSEVERIVAEVIASPIEVPFYLIDPDLNFLEYRYLSERCFRKLKRIKPVIFVFATKEGVGNEN